MQISGGKFSHKKLKDLNTEKAMHLNGEEYTALIKGGNADEFHTHDFQELLEEYFKKHSFGSGGGGGGVSAWAQLTDTPSAIQANKGVRGNAEGTALEFYNVAENRIVETKTDNYIVTSSDAAKTLVMNAATEKTFSLPSVGVSNLGLWFSFVKLGAGKLVIAAADSDVIVDSGAGKTIYNDQPNETYATITLQLVTETNWVITGAHGIWATTE